MNLEKYPEKIYVNDDAPMDDNGINCIGEGCWCSYFLNDRIEYIRADLVGIECQKSFLEGQSKSDKEALQHLINVTDTLKLIPRWHKYPDELPPCGKHVVLSIDNSEYIGFLNERSGVYSWHICGDNGWYGTYILESVTAWQELPKPFLDYEIS